MTTCSIFKASDAGSTFFSDELLNTFVHRHSNIGKEIVDLVWTVRGSGERLHRLSRFRERTRRVAGYMSLDRLSVTDLTVWLDTRLSTTCAAVAGHLNLTAPRSLRRYAVRERHCVPGEFCRQEHLTHHFSHAPCTSVYTTSWLKVSQVRIRSIHMPSMMSHV